MKSPLRVSLFLSMLAVVSPVFAANVDSYYYWNLEAGEGWVDDGSLWTSEDGLSTGHVPGVTPNTEDETYRQWAVIRNAGLVKIDAGHVPWGASTNYPQNLWVGHGSDTFPGPFAPSEGHVLQTGGDVGYQSYCFVGRDQAPGTSTYDLQGGSLSQIYTGTGYLIIGDSYANGVMTVSNDASVSAPTGVCRVGDGPASNGVLSMSGTSQLSANYLTVAGYGADGELATGVVNLSGSAKMTLGRDVSIGSYYYTDGAVNVAGDATLDIGRRLNIGDNSNSTYPDAVGAGALNIKENGTVNTPEMRLGKYQYGVGTTTVSSATGTATLNVGGSMTIGWSGGTGTLVVDAGGTVNHGADWVAVGSEARTGFTSTGTVIMNGGLFSHTDATTGIAIGIDGQTGAWTQNGGALISDGPIRFGHDGGSASLSLNGGIFQTPSLAVDSESAPIVARVAFNGGTLKAGAAGDLLVDAPSPVLELDVQSGGAVIDSNSFDVTIGSDLTEDTSLPGGGLTKLGQGTLTLAGDNSYTGLTSIASGGLAVRGSITSDVAIADGASLAGDGMVDGNVTGVAGAHVRPGVGIGSLAVTGNLTLHGTLDVEYDGDNDTIDVLAVSGELDLSDATLSFSNLGASPLSNGVYVLATYGSLAGSAGSELGLVGDSFIDYAYGGNSIALVAVPEPSIAITILWLLAFAGARRVRTRQS